MGWSVSSRGVPGSFLSSGHPKSSNSLCPALSHGSLDSPLNSYFKMLLKIQWNYVLGAAVFFFLVKEGGLFMTWA